MPADEAAAVLATLRLPVPATLQRAASAANEVWFAGDHVVKLSNGRFRDSLSHESRVLAALPDAVPHPEVVGHGSHDGRDWLVLQRLPGAPLSTVWAGLDESARRAVGAEVAAAVQVMHAVAEPERFANPWVADALGPGGVRRNAYHAPPESYRLMVDAVRDRGEVDARLLDDVAAVLAAALPAFATDRAVLTHTDLHGGNILVDAGRLSGLLDFEGARPAAADQELDALIKFSGDDPDLGPVTEGEKSLRCRHFSEYVIAASADFGAYPRRAERLTAYALLWCLVQILNIHDDGAPILAGQLVTLVSRAG